MNNDDDDLDLGLGLDFGFNFNNIHNFDTFGTKPPSKYNCEQCGSQDFSKQDGGATLICRGCGHVLKDHIEHVEQEYDHILNGNIRQQRIKINTKKGEEAFQSQELPEKEDLFQGLKINKTKLLEQQLYGTFDLDSQKKSKFMEETPQNYIEAYHQILMTCAEKFFQTTICKIQTQINPEQLPFFEQFKTDYLQTVHEKFVSYMKSWGLKQKNQANFSGNIDNLVSSLTVPRRGQLREAITQRYGHLKRSFLNRANTTAQQWEQNQEDLDENLEMNLQGSLLQAGTLYEDQTQKEQLIKDKKVEISLRQKRLLKKMSSNDQSILQMRTNFIPDLQMLVNESPNKLLDLQDPTLNNMQLTLLDRAKLYIKFLFKTCADFKSLKFKQGRYLNLNDNILPSKPKLIDMCRHKLYLEHTKMQIFEGLSSAKDKLVMIIYMHHVIVNEKMTTRESLYEYITEKYPQQKLDGESEKNLEEILIDVFENEYLMENDSLRNEFEQYKSSPMQDEIPMIEQKSVRTKKSLLRGSIRSFKYKNETINNETEYCGITESVSPSVLEEIQMDMDFLENPATQPAHSLELNLILYFIYISGLKYGISEFDVLRAAQCNSFGYLTEFHHFTFLKKSWYLLRPINVPFKNKWLRDTAASLGSCDLQDPKYQWIAQRVLGDLKLLEIAPVVKMTQNLVKQIQNGGIANGYFDTVAAVAVVLKLLYGFNDVNWDQNGVKSINGEELLQKVKKEMQEDDEEMKNLAKNLEVLVEIPSQTEILTTIYEQVQSKTILWRSQDLVNFDQSLVIDQIDFAETNLYGISDDPNIISAWQSELEIKNEDVQERRFVQKSRSLATHFETVYQNYRSRTALKLKDLKSKPFMHPPVLQENENDIKLREAISRLEHSITKEDLELILPQTQYSRYNQKFQNYNTQYMHYDWVLLLKLFTTYLGEQTSYELLKSVKKIEKILGLS